MLRSRFLPSVHYHQLQMKQIQIDLKLVLLVVLFSISSTKAKRCDKAWIFKPLCCFWLGCDPPPLPIPDPPAPSPIAAPFPPLPQPDSPYIAPSVAPIPQPDNRQLAPPPYNTALYPRAAPYPKAYVPDQENPEATESPTPAPYPQAQVPDQEDPEQPEPPGVPPASQEYQEDSDGTNSGSDSIAEQSATDPDPDYDNKEQSTKTRQLPAASFYDPGNTSNKVVSAAPASKKKGPNVVAAVVGVLLALCVIIALACVLRVGFLRRANGQPFWGLRVRGGGGGGSRGVGAAELNAGAAESIGKSSALGTDGQESGGQTKASSTASRVYLEGQGEFVQGIQGAESGVGGLQGGNQARAGEGQQGQASEGSFSRVKSLLWAAGGVTVEGVRQINKKINKKKLEREQLNADVVENIGKAAESGKKEYGKDVEDGIDPLEQTTRLSYNNQPDFQAYSTQQSTDNYNVYEQFGNKETSVQGVNVQQGPSSSNIDNQQASALSANQYQLPTHGHNEHQYPQQRQQVYQNVQNTNYSKNSSNSYRTSLGY